LQEYQYTSATERFLRAHELDPDFLTALIFAGWASNNIGYAPELEPVRDSVRGLLYENQSLLTPHEAAIVDAWRAEQMGDLEGKIRAYEEACDLAPGEKACYNLGRQLLLTMNEPRRAIEVLTSRLEPEKGWMRGWSAYWQYLCQAYHSVGDFASQLECVKEARTYHPNSSNQLAYQAFALAGLGREDELLTFLADSLSAVSRLNRGYHLGWTAYAAFLAGQDDVAERLWQMGVVEWETLLEERPSSGNRRMWLAGFYSMVGRLDEAKELLEEAVSLSPGNRLFRTNLGFVHALMGDEVEARRVMDWLDAQTDYNNRLLYLAWLADALGEREEAWSYLSGYYEFAQEAIRNPFDIYTRLHALPHSP
jgi:tetratricopeptide (TPR) repeat protein